MNQLETVEQEVATLMDTQKDIIRRLEALEAAANHFADVSKMVPAPAGGLVERVAAAVAVAEEETWTGEARAAILAVAEWLDTRGQHGFSLWLRLGLESWLNP
jgi:hypothetical protein